MTHGWEGRAEELGEAGRIPERQAQVAALIEAGRTHQEVTDELDLGDRREVSTHVRRYRETREAAEWLVEHGPDV